MTNMKRTCLYLLLSFLIFVSFIGCGGNKAVKGIIEKESGRLIGFCGLYYVADMAEVNIGYAFEKSRWRQGLGFETGQAVLDFGFRELGLSEVVATIMPDNIASVKLAEKFGMTFWKNRRNWEHITPLTRGTSTP